jgi:hypothetical protein
MTQNSPAKARYIRVHLILTAAYLASVALASAFIPDDAAPSPSVIALALLPGLIVLGWIWNMGRYLFAMEDEYLRMLETRKALVATALTLGISGGWGLIELFSTVPRLPVFFIFPIWCLGLAAGGLVNKATTGDSGECSG